jgi:hypothetical protein
MNKKISGNKLRDKTSCFYKLFIELINTGFIVRLANIVKKAYVIITENLVQSERKIGEMAREMTGIYKMIC